LEEGFEVDGDVVGGPGGEGCAGGPDGIADVHGGTSTVFNVESGALDMVCFFFNLRHHILENTDTEDDHLIMDGASHALSITAGKPTTKKTDH